jgi:hypothetical protein
MRAKLIEDAGPGVTIQSDYSHMSIISLCPLFCRDVLLHIGLEDPPYYDCFEKRRRAMELVGGGPDSA